MSSSVAPHAAVPSTVPLDMIIPVVSVYKEHDDVVVASDWVGSDSIISCSWDSTIKYWDSSTLQTKEDIRCEFPAVGASSTPHLTNIRVHPNALTILGPGTDGLCRVWDLRSAQLIDLIAHSSERSSVTNAVFSHDGGLIITGGEDRNIKLWDTRSTQQPLDAIRCHSIQTKFNLSKRTNTLAIPMHDRKTKISDTQGMNVGSVETHKNHKSILTCALWSEDETMLFTSSMDERTSLNSWIRA